MSLESKLPSSDSEVPLEKAKFDSLKKACEALKKAMNPNIERITEVK